MTTKALVRADEAHAVHLQVVEARRGVEAGFIRLGLLLGEVLEKGHWGTLGYDSFDAYLAQPDLALRKWTAYQVVRVAACVTSHTIPPKAAAEIGVSKLDLIRRPLEEGEDAAAWLAEAQVLSRSDLRERVRSWAKKKGDPSAAWLEPEDEDRAEEEMTEARVADALGAARVEYRRFGALTVAMPSGQVLRCWAGCGHPLKVEVV